MKGNKNKMHLIMAHNMAYADDLTCLALSLSMRYT